MRLIFWRIIKWLQWYAAAKTIYRVHSPALFALANDVLVRTDDYYAFEDIAYLRKQMRASDLKIEYRDHGAGSSDRGAKSGVTIRSVADLARSSASTSEQGEMLFRLVLHLQPCTILELGTSLGVGALYLCTPNRAANYVGIEGNPDSAVIAKTHLDMLGCQNTHVLAGTFDEQLIPALHLLKSVDFCYIDGDHREEPTCAYFEQILPYLSERAVVVFDDIYWSEGMLRAWERIRKHERVTASLDLWDMGIVLLDPAFEQPVHLKLIRSDWKWWERYV